MFDILRKYSSSPIEDQLKLWDRIIYNYFIGNADCHIKNFSLTYGRELKGIRLAPAYDMLSTVIYDTSRDMSLSIGDVYALDDITRDSFLREAESIGLGTRIAAGRYDDIRERFRDALLQSAEELHDAGFAIAADIAAGILKRAESGPLKDTAKFY